MKCYKCESKGEDKKAAIKLQNGAYCKEHFLNYLEEKIFKTIRKYNLILESDTVCVAASGGKDSLTALYFTFLFCKERNIPMFALMIDEGILGYREKTEKDLRDFCKKFEITLHIASFKKEFGMTLDEMGPITLEKFGRKPCTTCGIFRRLLLNTKARELGATKLVTGHNQDDESQAFIMNVMQGHQKQNAGLGPLAGLNDNEMYVRRVKPLYFVSEKESRLFCLLKGFNVEFGECPYVTYSYRADIRDMLNLLEEKYPSTKSSIINSFLDISLELKQKYNNQNTNSNNSKFKYCSVCGEPCSGEICNACKLIGEIGCKRPKAKQKK